MRNRPAACSAKRAPRRRSITRTASRSTPSSSTAASTSSSWSTSPACRSIAPFPRPGFRSIAPLPTPPGSPPPSPRRTRRASSIAISSRPTSWSRRTTASRSSTSASPGARRSPPNEATQLSTVEGTLAGTGVLIGTAGYMSPEQVQAQPADERSDVFAIGVIIYELLTGTAPFRRQTTWGSLEATVHYTPAPVDAAHRGIPPALTAIVSRCLAKDPAQRPASAGELHRELEAVRHSLVDAGPRRRWNRVAVIAGVVAIVAIAVAAFALSRVREGRLRWVRDTAIPEIHRLIAAGDPMAAYRLALKAKATLPDDPQLKAVWEGMTHSVPLATEPPGAAASIRALSGKDEGWVVARQLARRRGRASRTVAMAIRARRPRPARDRAESVPGRSGARPYAAARRTGWCAWRPARSRRNAT